MNAKQTQYAIELSKDLNVSQTAERLGISQPALSKQILALEKELGVKLFDRSTLPMTITAAGEHYIRQAQELLYREDQLLRSLEAYKTGESGRLVIGVSPFRCQYLLSDVIRRVREQYEGVQVILCEAPSDQLRQDAAEGKYDLAVVNLPVDEAALDVTVLEPDEMVLAVPKDMAGDLPETSADNPTSIDFSQCANLSFVTLGDQQEMRRQFEEACRVARFHPHIAAEVVGGLSTAYALCRAGVGATLVPLQYVRYCGAEDGVKWYALRQPIQSRLPVIITRRGQYLSPYAKYTIELLTKSKEEA